MSQYEVEIKSLLGEKPNADLLLEKLQADPSFENRGQHNQLNHYFIDGDLLKLAESLDGYLAADKRDQLHGIAANARDYSVRTRQADQQVILVIKASTDDTTSSNGTARMEFESVMGLSLAKLDQLLLDAGFQYQAKWSRERQEFKYKGINVVIDKNAGYGYLAEFEKVITEPGLVDQTKDEIRNLMSEIGVVELNQNRLARMFEFYNNHWQDYYGTEKVFNIE